MVVLNSGNLVVQKFDIKRFFSSNNNRHLPIPLALILRRRFITVSKKEKY